MRFGPDPSTHNRCTIGGMIGNNACGSHSIRYGKTDVNVARLTVATYDGAVLDLGRLGETGGDTDRAALLDRALRQIVTDAGDAIRSSCSTPLPRRVSGYGLSHLLPEHGANLAAAFVGSEGTCALVLDATVRLVDLPAGKALLVLGFPDIFLAADAIPELASASPLTVEGMDRRIVDLASRSRRPTVDLPAGDGFLLVEIDGEDDRDAAHRAEQLGSVFAGGGATYSVLTGAAATEAWRIREDGAGLATRLADGSEAWPGFEDAAVPPENLGKYLREFEALLNAHRLQGVPYGHFGEGCVHVRIDFDLLTNEGVRRFRTFMEAAAALVVSYGGSLSGEHGDGQARGELVPMMYEPKVLSAFSAFKAAFDPDDGMNPGRGIAPRKLDEDLRVRDLRPSTSLPTILDLGADGHDLSVATRRCVGVGRCVRLDAGSMCPSYQVTRDEQHSTRGRARLIAEMLGGDFADDAWRSDEVRDALDLCLGCKACRVECPVGVDMATYRVEFLAQHYRRRLRPRTHYAFGSLPLVLRVAARAPGVFNALVSHPSLGQWIRRLGGVDHDAALPTITKRRRVHQPLRRPSRPSSGSAVVQFADCFTTYADPKVGEAASDVLSTLGIATSVVGGATCCGLTWFSTGQLSIARAVLRRTVRALRRSGNDPIIVLEPSCAGMIRDDGEALLGEDLSDIRARIVSIGEVVGPALAAAAERGEVAFPDAPIVTQVHCHAYAAGAYGHEVDAISTIGGTVHSIETACCGLAGNFGLEEGHTEIANAIAERHILAALAKAPAEAVVMADGYSCRTQVEARSTHRARHFIEIVRDALAPPGGR
jgi:Fe-S oxidoreductase/FAD/FMN-containing dehydrogenase